MADTQNTIKTRVELDVTQAQQEIIRLNAAATDSTKSLKERLVAKNEAVKIQNQLMEQTIELYEEEVKLLEATGATEKDIEKAKKKLNGERIKQTRTTENNDKAQRKLTEAYKDSRNPIKQLDSATGGLLGKMQAFIANPIGVVITALVGLFTLFKKAINSTEDGQAKLAAITGALGQVFTNIVTILSDALQPILDWLVDALSKYLNPVFVALGGAVDVVIAGFKAWLDVVNLMLTPIKAIIAGVQAAALALEGDFAGAKQVMIDFTNSTVEAAESMVDSFKEVGQVAVEAFEETTKAFTEADGAATSLISSAAQIELAQNTLNKSKREQQKLDAELNVQAKNALRDSKDFELSFERRTKALQDYAALEAERNANAKKVLDDEIALLERRRGLGGNTKEDEEKYNNLLIERINLDALIADKEREIIKARKTLISEQLGAEAKLQAEKQKAIDEEEKRKEEKLAKDKELAQREYKTQLEIDEIDLERRRQKGENVLNLELELLNRKMEQELSNTELLESERTAIIERYKLQETNLKQKADEAKIASDKQYTKSALGAAAEVFGMSQQLALAEMIMAAPKAIGSSFAKAAETYPFPLSLAMGAAGAAGTVIPIIKGISDIKKAKVKGAPPSSGGTAPNVNAAIKSPPAIAAVTDIGANNAARLAQDPSLTQASTQIASASVQGGVRGEVVFSEDNYRDFKNQVQFKEDKTTF